LKSLRNNSQSLGEQFASRLPPSIAGRLGVNAGPRKVGKVLGVALGERSLLAAEVVAGADGGRPEVRRLAELVYPEGVSPSTPDTLGEALAGFLREHKFTAKTAVFGLPARWLVVKAKDVPPADSTTLANLLRLQAEGEFSSELKDLVYDYVADTSHGMPRSVLLLATSRKYLDGINTICDAAKLSPLMVTSSAAALGLATGRSTGASNPLVLLVSPAGAELTAQKGESSSAIQHLRGPGPDRPFVGELRRAISGMPPVIGGNGANGTSRELVLWDAAGASEFNSATLGESLGISVRSGDLPILGVNTTDTTSNGEGRKYAAAVALGLLAVVDGPVSVDFLHSRLAPPKPALVPHWVIYSSVGVIALLALIFIAWNVMQKDQAQLTKLQAQNDARADAVVKAQKYVTKVSFAQAWHLGTPRYLACLTDLTNAIPRGGETYAISLIVREIVPPTDGSITDADAALMRSAAVHDLAGRLEGKTTDQRRVLDLMANLKSKPSVFSEVKLEGTNNGGRNGEVSFTITFTYKAPAPKAKA
jgi:Tfp pilus assembly protein PilN